MKAWKLIFKTPLMLAGLAPVMASAQQEQWLEYHTGQQTQGYRWLEVSTNAPADLALPRLEPGAWFGRWANGMESGEGRWFCLDRTRKSGPCNRLFFDANGDGRLEDESPVAVTRQNNYSVYFDPVKVVFQGEDGPVSYHLSLRSLQYQKNETRVLASSGCWYEGKVDFGGKSLRLRLQDNTVNGTFNDNSRQASGCDRVRMSMSGKATADRYLGRYLEVDDDLFEIEVTPDGAFVKVKPAKDVTFGTVRLPEAISKFTAIGENGHFVRQPDAGRLSLPVGSYRIYTWTIERKDPKGVKWQLSGSGIGPQGNFEVTPGQSHELDIGEPVRPALQASQTKTRVRFSLRLLGSLGETVTMQQGKRRPRAPKLQVASLTGSYDSTHTFEYG